MLFHFLLDIIKSITTTTLLTHTYPPPIKAHSQRNSRDLSHSDALQDISIAAAHFAIKGYQLVIYTLMIDYFTFYFLPMISKKKSAHFT